MSTNPHKVFVYGTLKTGQPNNYILKERGAKCLGVFATVDRLVMVDLGAYPACYRDAEKGGAVVGEVWECDDEILADLDHLEGHPTFYRRETIEVCWGEGYRPVKVLAYLLPADHDCLIGKPRVENGVWTWHYLERRGAK
jgi:gamma-glutamylcyclotransferase (GGCT)/AIG2-like uncharacterized protein YtfP